mmetsp:Transcript_83610/g.202785  ORF Transcript_83610/g.202785 Transcript_83610/m.202785 type:complete len:110 (+) Transcript_83610:214-543(+)
MRGQDAGPQGGLAAGAGSYLQDKPTPPPDGQAEPSAEDGQEQEDVYDQFFTAKGFREALAASITLDCYTSGKLFNKAAWCHRAYPIMDIIVLLHLLLIMFCICCAVKMK